ncbi:MAG: hypothetical protein HYT38_02605 [Candidatus Sungbacteria bacterium]|uniref:Uncharacterized protein n=1 Tax=Candidatus Sungiibacteriota bacterium TaxID=2750080 RepID=A0A931YDQ6_9BACT|nr:hypothetical protein [Candidatus Sungbacteria bacterium]MBI2466058.1 hypothetical protein [Candidatus Sungbacteria bacterium]
MWVVGAIIAYIIIASIFVFWKITLPIFILCIMFFLTIKQKKAFENEREEKKKKQEEILLEEKNAQERVRQEIATRELHKKEREQRIGKLITNSQLLSQNLSERIVSARKAMDTAEREYQDGAFAPFWDAVELAVTSLAHFDTGVRQIGKNYSEYQTEIKQLESPPVFDWKKAADVPDAITTANRLQKIVRAGQRNFQFAVIYEQRKTNQILVAGFAGLGQALSQIAYRISESTGLLSAAVADLSFTVSDTSAQAIEADRENARAIMESIKVIRRQTKAEAEAEAEARREYERRELEMLDNIQRRRVPSLLGAKAASND